MKNLAWICVIAFSIIGCSPLQLGRPTIVNHSRPELAVNLQPFEDAGCVPDDSGNWSCPEDGPIAGLGCSRLQAPSGLLGALDPAYPIMICRLDPYGGGSSEGPAALMDRMEEEGYLYRRGCMMPSYIRYVIWRDGAFQLVRSPAEFQNVFAPVSSADEALSYALALTGRSPYFGIQLRPGYRYLVNGLEDTHVAQAGQGDYLVHLFSYQVCGCGPHTTSAVDLLVSQDGQVTTQEVIPLYEDPEEDDLCVD